MKKGKKKRKKIINWESKAHREKIFIMVLISVIVLLTLYIGYDIYDSFQTKDETSYLNSAVIRLSEEKSQLVLERDAFNQTVILLTQQKTQLIAEKGDLTSELAALQEDYDALSQELQGVEDDLEDCLALVP